MEHINSGVEGTGEAEEAEARESGKEDVEEIARKVQEEYEGGDVVGAHVNKIIPKSEARKKKSRKSLHKVNFRSIRKKRPI